MSTVTSMGAKMALAFALVAVLSVAAVGVAARMAVSSEFRSYLRYVQARPAEPFDAVSPSDERHLTQMRRMMGPRWAAVMGVWMGVPERRFLNRVEDLLWRVGAGAALFGAAVGIVMARGMSLRLSRLAHRALGRARQSAWKAPDGGDEIDQLDAAFTVMERALDEEDRRRRRLLADIAHELKTPLTVVQASLEAMLDGVVPASPERLTALHGQVALLGRLVKDLRDLALAEAGELALHRRPTDMAQLAAQIVDLWRPQAQEKGVEVELEARDAPVADVDPDRIGQVLLNLLSNALRHTPAGSGRIRVRVTSEPGRVFMEVEDNGTGISPADLPYIFDHFYRGDPSRARATGGFGVGLSIVRSLVEAHGGSVSAENRPEGGARFRVALPAARPAATPAAGSERRWPA